MEEAADLVLDRPLEHELGTQPAELGEPFQAVVRLEPAEQRLLDRSFYPGARGYPSFHGVVLLMRTSRSASEPMPCSLFQRSPDATLHGTAPPGALVINPTLIWKDLSRVTQGVIEVGFWRRWSR
jgi:hypothetical protein